MERFLAGGNEGSMGLDENERNLLDAVRFFVGKICESTLHPKVPTNEFVGQLTALVYYLLTDRIADDILLFSRHAHRKMINEDDVILFARKTSLCQHLKDVTSERDAMPEK